MLLADPRDGAIYAALDYGHFGVKLQRSDDGGASWSEIAAPSYAGVDADQPNPPSLKLIWALEIADPDQPGTLWAGTIPGGLFHSSDRGETWTLNRGLWDQPQRKDWMGVVYDQAGIHSVCVDPRDKDRVAVAVSTGGVWETGDGGRTWTLGGQGLRAAYLPPEQAHDPAMQDVHRLVRCQAEPDAFWIQHHNGVFRAESGIGQWREMAPAHSTFGFAVAVHPKSPATAWVVPAIKDEFRCPHDGKVIVKRTTDGGGSFETLTEGLPQENAYDLVYRHSLDVDETGERLAMGSTTGGLWLSEDGGDAWTQAPARLPPVYAVRFG
jgi:photosystem II stability/assembly factor-like uncharacterized protein